MPTGLPDCISSVSSFSRLRATRTMASKACPVARGLARSAVDDQVVGPLGHFGVEVVHQHAQSCFLLPAFAGPLRVPRGARISVISLDSKLSKSPRRIPFAQLVRYLSLKPGPLADGITYNRMRCEPPRSGARSCKGDRYSRPVAAAISSMASTLFCIIDNLSQFERGRHAHRDMIFLAA